MPVVEREELRQLLLAWRDGDKSAGDVVIEARARWIAGDGASADSIATTVLMMLATANQGLSHDDIPALLEWLATPPGEEGSGLERFGDYILALDLDERARLHSTGYYGSAGSLEEDFGFYEADPEHRRIHVAVHEDPESVWEEVRAALCKPPDWDNRDEAFFLAQIVDDLVIDHSEAFVDRLIALAEECPPVRERLMGIVVGGVAPTPAHDRFLEFQARLQTEFDATR